MIAAVPCNGMLGPVEILENRWHSGIEFPPGCLFLFGRRSGKEGDKACFDPWKLVAPLVLWLLIFRLRSTFLVVLLFFLVFTILALELLCLEASVRILLDIIVKAALPVGMGAFAKLAMMGTRFIFDVVISDFNGS